MQIVDAHCHLNDEALAARLHADLDAARAAGVTALITNGTCPEDWGAQRALAAARPEVRFAWGVHPWFAREEHLGVMDRLRGARDAGAVAIGEIGLDVKVDVPMTLQERLFTAQLDVADALGLPVVIHCRGAFDILQRILHARGPLPSGGIVHAFSGSPEIARDLVAHGLSFSMGASLSYRPSRKRRAVLDLLWPERLLLETDCPDMPPAQAPERPNTPANILYNLRGLLQYVDAGAEEAAAVTTRNAARVFGLELS